MPGISLTVMNTSNLEPEDWDDLCGRILDRLEELTPVDTGFCQSNWEETHDDESATFTNDTDYASYLDDGWSQQAPNGMTEPLLDELPSMVDDYFVKKI
jgi:hypothetical protein